MIERDIKLPSRETYPVEPWRYVQKKLSQEYLGRDEAIFALSNGYIGLRGSFEEGEPAYEHNAFVSGFYESWPIVYGEDAYGFAKTGQTMLNATNGHTIKLFVDDEPFSLRHAYILDFERALDLKNGVLTRRLIWDTASGKKVQITSERLVSFPERHLAVTMYKVKVLNEPAHLTFASEIYLNQPGKAKDSDDPRKAPKMNHRVFNAELQELEKNRIVLGHSTSKSRLQMVCGVDHLLETPVDHDLKTQVKEFRGRASFSVDVRKGQEATLYKFISYHTSSPHSSIEELGYRVNRTLDRAVKTGYHGIRKQQSAYLKEFWKKSDIEIGGNPQVDQYVRLHVFHLLQASARVQNAGVGAKGLTGSGYEGHSFWDIEVYMLPFLVYNLPRVAKNLLIYRFNMLDQARTRARQLNQKGALFPWRTINGEEASAFFEAGTAQYHINADIAYAIKKYCEVTKDQEFLFEYGAEMLIETARLWADLGFFNGDSKFHIYGVTGPDEYNAIVNDNAFTNLMARENMHYAAGVVAELKKKDAKRFKLLARKTKLEDSEVTEWQQAADSMYVPYDKDLGINPQDESFLQKEVWDLTTTPKDKFPLLLHYHPLVLYRFQVIKQADIVLATFLLGDEFSTEIKKRNFDYYDPLTTGDSSLSVSIQGIMAAELGYMDLATKYFTYALLMDVADIGGNVADGLHLASMGGIWMSVVYGVAGMRDYDGNLDFNPKLLKDTKKMKFRLSYGESLLEVSLEHGKTTYKLIEGIEMSFKHKNKAISLKSGQSKVFK